MNHQKKIRIVSIVCLVNFCLIVCIFWWYDYQYSLPTPRPPGHKEIPLGHNSAIQMPEKPGKPILVHFFNANCPCSRFNTDHFSYLVKNYSDQLDFIIIFQNKAEDVDSSYFSHLSGNIRYIIDAEGIYADSLGVYATPQAVLLDKEGRIFYRGNYNKTRYCASEKTQYARLAIDELLNDQTKRITLVNYSEALTPYGCQLPSDK